MAVDQIMIDNPGRVVATEWHLRSGYPQYLYEASQKMRLYPPPRNGLYYTPWLWLDGRQRGSGYSQWSSFVQERLSVETDIGLSLSGSYDPVARTGELVAEFSNAGADSLVATCNVVVTEDSIYYPSPNGDQWHSHVCRDYVPDQYGTQVMIPAGGVDTLVIGYTIDQNWDQEQCKVVVFLQSPDVKPDSTRPAYQGGEVRVMELVGVKEQGPNRQQLSGLSVLPNPLTGMGRFCFQATVGSQYSLKMFAADGRLVRSLGGVVTRADMSVAWDRTDDAGLRVARGIYAYRLRTGSSTSFGKLVVVD